MSATVASAQRFKTRQPCPVCGGGADMPAGRGVRCYGFLGSDGRYAHCTREEFAENLEREPEGGTYAHRLSGSCRCGETHREPEPEAATIRGNGAGRRTVATYDYTDETCRLLYQSV